MIVFLRTYQKKTVIRPVTHRTQLLLRIKSLLFILLYTPLCAIAQTPSQFEDPECVVGPPQEVCASDAAVSLDGSSSFSREGRTITFSWNTNCPGGLFDDSTSATPTLSFTPPSTTTLPTSCQAQLIVQEEHPDGSFCADACLAIVNIIDCTTPSPTPTPDTTPDPSPSPSPTPDVDEDILECETNDISPVQLEIDGIFNTQVRIIQRASRKLLRKSRGRNNRQAIRDFVLESRAEASEVQSQGWFVIWSIPSLALSCVDTANVCTQVSTLENRDEIIQRSLELQDILTSIVRRLRRLGAVRFGNNLLARGQEQVETNATRSEDLPTEIFSCPE